jgi:ABC-type transport system substrate-binding protein
MTLSLGAARRPALLCSLLLAACLAPLPTLDAQDGKNAEPPIRVGIRARNGGADRLTSLRYVGGFETKTMLYETLVRRGSDGRIAPALATRWEIVDGGRAIRFELRDGATFHDGSKVTADVVATHFRRWIGLPEHDWLAGNRRITNVAAESERTFRIDLDRPYALLEDLVAINPCAVVGPGTKDWEGEFLRPVGTGTYRFVGAYDGGKRWRVEKASAEGPTIDVTFYPRGRDATPIDDLQAGRIDAFVGGWDEDLPAERLDALGQDPEFRVQEAPGSSVVWLSFRLTDGPTADVTIRRHLASVLQREALVTTVEGGRAEPCTTWAAPSVAFWPRGKAPPAVAPPTTLPKLRLAAGRGEARATRAAAAVATQLRAAGYEVELLTAPTPRKESATAVVDATSAATPQTTESGEVRAKAERALREATASADLRIEITHGMPYCPHQSLVARFGTPVPGQRERTGVAPDLRALVDRAAAEPDEAARLPIYAAIQDLMTAEALTVPLYVPRRIALRRAGIDGIRLGPDVYHADFDHLHRTATK